MRLNLETKYTHNHTESVAYYLTGKSLIKKLIPFIPKLLRTNILTLSTVTNCLPFTSV